MWRNLYDLKKKQKRKESEFLPILDNFKGSSDEPLSSPSLPELVSHALMTQYETTSTFTQNFNTSQKPGQKEYPTMLL